MKTLRQENEQLKEELARMHEDMLDLQRQLAEIPEEA
jgi:predicted nuclease with TOPRIM domain